MSHRRSIVEDFGRFHPNDDAKSHQSQRHPTQSQIRPHFVLKPCPNVMDKIIASTFGIENSENVNLLYQKDDFFTSNPSSHHMNEDIEAHNDPHFFFPHSNDKENIAPPPFPQPSISSTSSYGLYSNDNMHNDDHHNNNTRLALNTPTQPTTILLDNVKLRVIVEEIAQDNIVLDTSLTDNTGFDINNTINLNNLSSMTSSNQTLNQSQQLPQTKMVRYRLSAYHVTTNTQDDRGTMQSSSSLTTPNSSKHPNHSSSNNPQQQSHNTSNTPQEALTGSRSGVSIQMGLTNRPKKLVFSKTPTINRNQSSILPQQQLPQRRLPLTPSISKPQQPRSQYNQQSRAYPLSQAIIIVQQKALKPSHRRSSSNPLDESPSMLHHIGNPTHKPLTPRSKNEVQLNTPSQITQPTHPDNNYEVAQSVINRPRRYCFIPQHTSRDSTRRGLRSKKHSPTKMNGPTKGSPRHRVLHSRYNIAPIKSTLVKQAKLQEEVYKSLYEKNDTVNYNSTHLDKNSDNNDNTEEQTYIQTRSQQRHRHYTFNTDPLQDEKMSKKGESNHKKIKMQPISQSQFNRRRHWLMLSSRNKQLLATCSIGFDMESCQYISLIDNSPILFDPESIIQEHLQQQNLPHLPPSTPIKPILQQPLIDNTLQSQSSRIDEVQPNQNHQPQTQHHGVSSIDIGIEPEKRQQQLNLALQHWQNKLTTLASLGVTDQSQLHLERSTLIDNEDINTEHEGSITVSNFSPRKTPVKSPMKLNKETPQKSPKRGHLINGRRMTLIDMEKTLLTAHQKIPAFTPRKNGLSFTSRTVSKFTFKQRDVGNDNNNDKNSFSSRQHGIKTPTPYSQQPRFEPSVPVSELVTHTSLAPSHRKTIAQLALRKSLIKKRLSLHPTSSNHHSDITLVLHSTNNNTDLAQQDGLVQNDIKQESSQQSSQLHDQSPEQQVNYIQTRRGRRGKSNIQTQHTNTKMESPDFDLSMVSSGLSCKEDHEKIHGNNNSPLFTPPLTTHTNPTLLPSRQSIMSNNRRQTIYDHIDNAVLLGKISSADDVDLLLETMMSIQAECLKGDNTLIEQRRRTIITPSHHDSVHINDRCHDDEDINVSIVEDVDLESIEMVKPVQTPENELAKDDTTMIDSIDKIFDQMVQYQPSVGSHISRSSLPSTALSLLSSDNEQHGLVDSVNNNSVQKTVDFHHVDIENEFNLSLSTDNVDNNHDNADNTDGDEEEEDGYYIHNFTLDESMYSNCSEVVCLADDDISRFTRPVNNEQNIIDEDQNEEADDEKELETTAELTSFIHRCQRYHARMSLQPQSTYIQSADCNNTSNNNVNTHDQSGQVIDITQKLQETQNLIEKLRAITTQRTIEENEEKVVETRNLISQLKENMALHKPKHNNAKVKRVEVNDGEDQNLNRNLPSPYHDDDRNDGDNASEFTTYTIPTLSTLSSIWFNDDDDVNHMVEMAKLNQNHNRFSMVYSTDSCSVGSNDYMEESHKQYQYHNNNNDHDNKKSWYDEANLDTRSYFDYDDSDDDFSLRHEDDCGGDGDCYSPNCPHHSIDEITNGYGGIDQIDDDGDCGEENDNDDEDIIVQSLLTHPKSLVPITLLPQRITQQSTPVDLYSNDHFDLDLGPIDENSCEDIKQPEDNLLMDPQQFYKILLSSISQQIRTKPATRHSKSHPSNQRHEDIDDGDNNLDTLNNGEVRDQDNDDVRVEDESKTKMTLITIAELDIPYTSNITSPSLSRHSIDREAEANNLNEFTSVSDVHTTQDNNLCDLSFEVLVTSQTPDFIQQRGGNQHPSYNNDNSQVVDNNQSLNTVMVSDLEKEYLMTIDLDDSNDLNTTFTPSHIPSQKDYPFINYFQTPRKYITEGINRSLISNVSGIIPSTLTNNDQDDIFSYNDDQSNNDTVDIAIPRSQHDITTTSLGVTLNVSSTSVNEPYQPAQLLSIQNEVQTLINRYAFSARKSTKKVQQQQQQQMRSINDTINDSDENDDQVETIQSISLHQKGNKKDNCPFIRIKQTHPAEQLNDNDEDYQDGILGESDESDIEFVIPKSRCTNNANSTTQNIENDTLRTNSSIIDSDDDVNPTDIHITYRAKHNQIDPSGKDGEKNEPTNSQNDNVNNNTSFHGNEQKHETSIVISDTNSTHFYLNTSQLDTSLLFSQHDLSTASSLDIVQGATPTPTKLISHLPYSPITSPKTPKVRDGSINHRQSIFHTPCDDLTECYTIFELNDNDEQSICSHNTMKQTTSRRNTQFYRLVNENDDSSKSRGKKAHRATIFFSPHQLSASNPDSHRFDESNSDIVESIDYNDEGDLDPDQLPLLSEPNFNNHVEAVVESVNENSNGIVPIFSYLWLDESYDNIDATGISFNERHNHIQHTPLKTNTTPVSMFLTHLSTPERKKHQLNNAIDLFFALDDDQEVNPIIQITPVKHKESSIGLYGVYQPETRSKSAQASWLNSPSVNKPFTSVASPPPSPSPLSSSSSQSLTFGSPRAVKILGRFNTLLYKNQQEAINQSKSFLPEQTSMYNDVITLNLLRYKIRQYLVKKYKLYDLHPKDKKE